MSICPISLGNVASIPTAIGPKRCRIAQGAHPRKSSGEGWMSLSSQKAELEAGAFRRPLQRAALLNSVYSLLSLLRQLTPLLSCSGSPYSKLILSFAFCMIDLKTMLGRHMKYTRVSRHALPIASISGCATIAAMLASVLRECNSSAGASWDEFGECCCRKTQNQHLASTEQKCGYARYKRSRAVRPSKMPSSS